MVSAKTIKGVGEMLKELRPYDVGIPKIRVGSKHDGGYVMLDLNFRGARSPRAAYSYGIGPNVDWDLEMAEKFRFDVFQYDHTVKKSPVSHPRFRFKRQGVGTPKDKNRLIGALGDHLKENRHERRADLTMKMDIEGAEWELFRDTSRTILRSFEQITAEFHAVSQQFFYERAAILRKLNKDFYIFHVHAVNYGRVARLGPYHVPNTLEISFVRKDLVPKARPSRAKLPASVDSPCDPYVDDIKLDFFPYAPGRR